MPRRSIGDDEDPQSFTRGRTTPCGGCPWRIDNAARSRPDWETHHANAATFDGTQGFHVIMACHTLSDGDGACVGYLLSEHAFDNLAVRLATLTGGLDPNVLVSNGDLHSTYAAMAAELADYHGKPEGRSPW